MTSHSGLVKYQAALQAAKQALALASTVGEAKSVRDKAEAIRVWARAAGNLEMQNAGAEVRLWAERTAGELLRETSQNGQRYRRGGDRISKSAKTTLRLSDYEISKDHSSEWQKLATVTESKFQAAIAGVKEDSGELTTDGVLRFLFPHKKAALEFNPQELPEGVYDIILADPPWRYDFAETESREIENQYPTMDVEEICALTPPIADNAVLFMWATAPKLREALAVIEAWECDYKTHAVWQKDKIGMGYWFRGQHELLMVATRGDWPPPVAEARQSSWIEAPRGKHSQKPKEIYRLIESMFPKHTNRLELFAREPQEGWEAWGNESIGSSTQSE